MTDVFGDLTPPPVAPTASSFDVAKTNILLTVMCGKLDLLISLQMACVDVPKDEGLRDQLIDSLTKIKKELDTLNQTLNVSMEKISEAETSYGKGE